MTRFVFGLVVFGILVVGSMGTTLGGTIAYVYTVDGTFGTMDLQTGAFNSIGPGGANYQNMTSQPGGPLYAADPSTMLLTIDTHTGGISTVIGTMGNNINGLKFDESGTLFGFSRTDLYTVNPTNAAVTLVGATGLSGSSFAYDAIFKGNTMYWEDTTGPGNTSNLYTVNTSTGMASLVGNIGFEVNAMDYQNGTLYGFTVNGQIITIDTATATGTFLVNQGSPGRVVSATAAVPEPGSVCLLGIGIAGAVVSVWWARTRSGADNSLKS